jgi:outer membrane protein OmpA-like peptidoglycan-associated protein
MKSSLEQETCEGSSTVAGGIADLMTSLAVIFILLLAAYITKIDEGNATPTHSTSRATIEREVMPPQPHHLTSERSRTDPDVMRIVIPETMLNFESGKSTLSPQAEAFLTDTMPYYGTMICGLQGHDVESFVIEGYTDDQGDDLHNLKLSQDRSFAVLVKGLEIIRARLPWAYECFQQKTSASGRGRQDLLRHVTGQTDRDGSRRVIFKFHLRHT